MKARKIKFMQAYKHPSMDLEDFTENYFEKLCINNQMKTKLPT